MRTSFAPGRFPTPPRPTLSHLSLSKPVRSVTPLPLHSLRRPVSLRALCSAPSSRVTWYPTQARIDTRRRAAPPRRRTIAAATRPPAARLGRGAAGRSASGHRVLRPAGAAAPARWARGATARGPRGVCRGATGRANAEHAARPLPPTCWPSRRQPECRLAAARLPLPPARRRARRGVPAAPAAVPRGVRVSDPAATARLASVLGVHRGQLSSPAHCSTAASRRFSRRLAFVARRAASCAPAQVQEMAPRRARLVPARGAAPSQRGRGRSAARSASASAAAARVARGCQRNGLDSPTASREPSSIVAKEVALLLEDDLHGGGGGGSGQRAAGSGQETKVVV